MALRRSRKKKFSSGNTRKTLQVFLFILLAGLGAAGFILFFEGQKPEIDLSHVPQYLAKKDLFDITVSDTGSGIRRIEVTASQGDQSHTLLLVENPRAGYANPVGPLSETRTVTLDSTKLGFKQGEVTIEVMVHDFSFRGMLEGNSESVQTVAKLDTRPPRLRILHSEQYISPGGSGIVIYQNDDPDSSHGVVINGFFNTGFPVDDGRDKTYIAYFGMPFNADKLEESVLKAVDVAGNTSVLPFTTTVKKGAKKKDRINISDGFLGRKVPEFEQYVSGLSGDNLEKYLQINRDIRQKNNHIISELCSNPADEQLWDGRFLRMAGSSKAGFADHRTYYYNQKPIDNQFHLGMDIASTRRAKIPAANAGKVVFADYLGIYGNMVLLDHGQGIFSLYSHMSQINVAVDDMVAKGDSLGLTGTSGMAGGDHLHFSVLVNGVFVSPVEWWDPHWIDVTISQPLIDSKF